MFRKSLARLLTTASRFRGNRSGNVVITFAFALLPLIGFAGAALDYSRANSARSAMQTALDSTALMLSRDAATLTTTQLQSKADAYFKALFTRAEIATPTVSATYTNQATGGGSTVYLSGSAKMNTALLGVLGIKTINITATSTAAWGQTRLRVALVLDTTGSMDNDGKMPALKTATKNLLTQLQNAATTNGDVYVSIIPFSKNVNVGSSNYNANWIDWTDWEAEPAIMSSWLSNSSNKANWEQAGPGDSCPLSTSSHGFRCAPNPTSTSTTNYIPSSGTYKGYICPSVDTGGEDSSKIGIMYNGCYNSVDAKRTISTGWSASCGYTSNCSCSGSGSSKKCEQSYVQHNWVKNAHSTWNGCVTDRGTASGPSSDYDRKVTAPSTSITASLFPAEQNTYCSPQIMGLNYNWSTMKTFVDDLYPLGATNQPIGLVWGWQSLVGGGPLTAPAKDSNYDYTEVIILMSDGLNTLNRWDGNGSSTSTSVDKRMYESATLGTCKNIKTAGVTIYALHVNTGGDPKSTLLENCASSADKFWMVTTAGDINTVFNAIGTNLTKLRIAK